MNSDKGVDHSGHPSSSLDVDCGIQDSNSHVVEEMDLDDSATQPLLPTHSLKEPGATQSPLFVKKWVKWPLAIFGGLVTLLLFAQSSFMPVSRSLSDSIQEYSARVASCPGRADSSGVRIER